MEQVLNQINSKLDLALAKLDVHDQKLDEHTRIR
jgi:hypothetical protein